MLVFFLSFFSWVLDVDLVSYRVSLCIYIYVWFILYIYIHIRVYELVSYFETDLVTCTFFFLKMKMRFWSLKCYSLKLGVRVLRDMHSIYI